MRNSLDPRRARVIVAAVVCVLLIAGVAVGAGVSMSVRRDPPVLWVKASVTGDAERVAIKIFAPSRRHGRWLYQRCQFTYSGRGDYRCGIDLQSARKYRGYWLARTLLDGTRVAKKWFRVRG